MFKISYWMTKIVFESISALPSYRVEYDKHEKRIIDCLIS